MAKETKRSGLMLGTIIGGVVGVASALLFAPKKGVELREDISNKYRTLSDKTEQFASTVGQKTQEFAKNVGSQIPDLVDKAKQSVLDSWQSVKEESQTDKDDQQSTSKPN